MRPCESYVGAVGVPAACATPASTANSAPARTSRRIRLRLAAERPELVAEEVQRRDRDDRNRLREHLPHAEPDERAEQDEVRAEHDARDDEEAHSLEGEVASFAAERPVPVPPVVARDRDDERDGRRAEIVQAG